MGTIHDGVLQPTVEDKTFEVLDDIKDILGTTKSFLWPFLESNGTRITAYKEDHDLTSSDEGGGVALESEFSPYKHPGGIHSYHFEPGGNNHLAGSDDADLSYGNGSNDQAMSIGAWVYPQVNVNNSIIAKWRSSATALLEYYFEISGGNIFNFLVRDNSASAHLIGNGATNLTLNKWSFGVGTYDGLSAADGLGLKIYLDGVDDTDTPTVSGTYVAMEDLAVPLLIGAEDLTASPAQEFDGRIALPFVCGKELSAAEAGKLFALSRKLIGV